MKLHVWGPLGQHASISPECLAAIWYVCLTMDDKHLSDVEVVQSSNVYLSPAHVLPALEIDNSTIISGYFSIVAYLKSLGHNLDTTFSSRELADIAALSSFVTSDVAPISTYMLYMVKPNFEQKIRPSFSSWVSFPMYYSLALDQQEVARLQCEMAGLNTSASADDPNPSVSDPTLGKILQKAEKQSQLLEQSKIAMHLLSRAQAVYNTVANMSSSSSSDNSSQNSYIFGERISSADLLLMGHLAIQTSSCLPAPILTNLIEQYPLLNQLLSSCKQLESLDRIKIRPPSPHEALTLSYWIKYKLGL